jgi:hypothetical protein
MFFIDFDVLLSYVDIAEERIDADRTMTTPPPLHLFCVHTCESSKFVWPVIQSLLHPTARQSV